MAQSKLLIAAMVMGAVLLAFVLPFLLDVWMATNARNSALRFCDRDFAGQTKQQVHAAALETGAKIHEMPAVLHVGDTTLWVGYGIRWPFFPNNDATYDCVVSFDKDDIFLATGLGWME